MSSDAEVVDFDQLARNILAMTPRCGSVRLVAVDGPGGSGKSVFAARLSSALGGAPVVHTDDFASPAEPTQWWPRMERQVLEPLCSGRSATFIPTAWTPTQVVEEVEIPPARVVIIEGVSSARLAVVDRLALSIWIEAPRAERLHRGICRDGESMRETWLRWMAAEDAHYAEDRTRERSDVIVDGAPTINHDPERQFVRLGR
jgi:uridine kinase